MMEMCSFSFYSKLKFLRKLHCNLNLNGKGQNFVIIGSSVYELKTCCPNLRFYSHKCISSCNLILCFSRIVSVKTETTLLMFEVSHYSSLTQKSKMVCLLHSQMVHVSKCASDSNEFASVFTRS